MMKPKKKHLWVTIEAKTSEKLRDKCKELYPEHIIIKESIIHSQYEKELKYKQVFILRRIVNKPQI